MTRLKQAHPLRQPGYYRIVGTEPDLAYYLDTRVEASLRAIRWGGPDSPLTAHHNLTCIYSDMPGTGLAEWLVVVGARLIIVTAYTDLRGLVPDVWLVQSCTDISIVAEVP